MYPLSKATENFRKSLEKANMIAAELGTSFVGSEHFIYAFLCLPECTAYKVLTAEGVRAEIYGGFFTKKVDFFTVFKKNTGVFSENASKNWDWLIYAINYS